MYLCNLSWLREVRASNMIKPAWDKSHKCSCFLFSSSLSSSFKSHLKTHLLQQAFGSLELTSARLWTFLLHSTPHPPPSRPLSTIVSILFPSIYWFLCRISDCKLLAVGGPWPYSKLHKFGLCLIMPRISRAFPGRVFLALTTKGEYF